VGLLSIAIFLGKVIALLFFFMWSALDYPALPLRPSHEARLADTPAALHRQSLFYAIGIAVIQK